MYKSNGHVSVHMMLNIFRLLNLPVTGGPVDKFLLSSHPQYTNVTFYTGRVL